MRSANEAAPWLYGDAAFAAQRAIFFLVAGYRQLNQRLRFHFEVNFSAAAVDQRTRGNHARSRLFHDANGLLRRAAGRPNVFDNQHMLVGRKRESAPQSHHAAGVALHKERGRSTTGGMFRLRQRSRYFLANNESTHRRRDNRVNLGIRKKRRQRSEERRVGKE